MLLPQEVESAVENFCQSMKFWYTTLPSQVTRSTLSTQGVAQARVLLQSDATRRLFLTLLQFLFYEVRWLLISVNC